MARATPSRNAPLRLPAGTRLAVVLSTYHEEITGAMLTSARETLAEAGLPPEDLIEVRVPGAFELPIVARRLARRPDVQAVISFGLVLRGQTDHDRYIAAAVAQALQQASLETDTPILLGVLTCNSLEQAEERARTLASGGLDKGREVATAAIGVLSALEEAERAGTQLEEIR